MQGEAEGGIDPTAWATSEKGSDITPKGAGTCALGSKRWTGAAKYELVGKRMGPESVVSFLHHSGTGRYRVRKLLNEPVRYDPL
jgi:hypothetical protein